MNIADRLAALDIDLAVWEEEDEGFRRAVFSPDLWPAIVELVREVDRYVDLPDSTNGIKLALEALEEAAAPSRRQRRSHERV